MNSELNEQTVQEDFELIAERILEASFGGESFDVRVRFGKPSPHPRGGWVCAYQITGTGSGTIHWAAGIDSEQALQLAMYLAGVHLNTVSIETKLAFLGEEDLGFPNSVREATGSCPYCKPGDATC